MKSAGEGLLKLSYELCIEFLGKSNVTEEYRMLCQEEIPTYEPQDYPHWISDQASSPKNSRQKISFLYGMLYHCNSLLKLIYRKKISIPSEKHSMEIMKSFIVPFKDRLRKKDLKIEYYNECLILFKIISRILLGSTDGFCLIQQNELKFIVSLMDYFIISSLKHMQDISADNAISQASAKHDQSSMITGMLPSTSKCFVYSLFRYLIKSGSMVANPTFSAFFHSLLRELIFALSKQKKKGEIVSGLAFLQETLIIFGQKYSESSQLQSIDFLFILLNSELLQIRSSKDQLESIPTAELEGKQDLRIKKEEEDIGSLLIKYSNFLFKVSAASTSSLLLFKLLNNFMLHIIKSMESYEKLLNIYKLIYCGICQKELMNDTVIVEITLEGSEKGTVSYPCITSENAKVWFDEFVVKLINIVLDYYKKNSSGYLHNSSIKLTERVIHLLNNNSEQLINISLQRRDIQEILMNGAINLEGARPFIYGIYVHWLGKIKLQNDRSHINFLNIMIDILLEKYFSHDIPSQAKQFYYQHLDLVAEIKKISQDLQYFIKALQFIRAVVVKNPENYDFCTKKLVREDMIGVIAKELIVKNKMVRNFLKKL